jgi:hypothetical protein
MSYELGDVRWAMLDPGYWMLDTETIIFPFISSSPSHGRGRGRPLLGIRYNY